MPITFESFSQDHPGIFECDHLVVRTDYSNLWDILNEHGVAIVPAIMTPEECEECLGHIHKFYEDLTKGFDKPYNHLDPTSFRSLSELHRLHSMLYQGYGVGQCQGSWNVRQHPGIYEVFARLWNDNDLLTSMDGMAYQIAPEQIAGNRADVGFFKHTWYHTDQSYSRNALECIQGQVPLFDVAPGDATLMVLEGSHKYHKAFAERFGEGSIGDWFLLEQKGKERGEGFLKFYEEMGCRERRLSCPRGSLILWDSRTIHCGSEPLRGRPNPNHWRSVVYVCMTARNLCDKKNMALRKKAFQELATTSHWPHRVNIFRTLATGMFVTHPPQLNLADHQYPILTELGKQLLLGSDGAEEYSTLMLEDIERVVPIIKSNGRPESAKDRNARLLSSEETNMGCNQARKRPEKENSSKLKGAKKQKK